jgi:hypothetical protein
MPETASWTAKDPRAGIRKRVGVILPGYMNINITRSKLRNEEWDQGVS